MLPIGKRITLNVESSDMIADIKAQIQEKANFAFERQKLTFHGKKLQNGRTLNEYNIPKNSTLELTLTQELNAF